MLRKLILISLLMGSLCASAQTPQQWRDSVSVLMEQIRLHPNSIDLRLRKAEANINLMQWDYALEEYGRVLRMESRNLAALYFRADYEAFLTIQPQHLEAHLGLAHVLQKMERKTDTMDELNRIVLLFPDSAQAYAARAAYETELRQYDVALYDWDEAIKRHPSDVSLAVSKVDVLLRMERRKEAREVLDALVAKGTPRGVLKEWYDRCK